MRNRSDDIQATRIGGLSIQRCGHPGQQHGLRMPPSILSMPTSIRLLLVASCLAEVTQQIHSFRASGVMSDHRLLAASLDSIAVPKSSGSLCTVPSASFDIAIFLICLFPELVAIRALSGMIEAFKIRFDCRPPSWVDSKRFLKGFSALVRISGLVMRRLAARRHLFFDT